MSEKFYAKGPGNEGYIKNMEVLAFHDLNGVFAFQTQLYKTQTGKYYLYCAPMKGGTMNILDVTDASNPVLVGTLQCVDDRIYKNQSCPKVQICDDLMVVALGFAMPQLHGTDLRDPNLGGIQIYSLKEDPLHPKLLSYWDTGVKQMGAVHRFCYNGGRYVHLSATCPGYSLMIYRIIDIQDPTHPVEVGRWWIEGQCMDILTDEQIKETYKNHGFLRPGFVHCVYVLDDKAYLSCTGAGFKIVDISDVTRPKTLGAISTCPPFSGKWGGANCHTFLPIIGTDFAVGLQEGERFWWVTEEMLREAGTSSVCAIEMFDVSNPKDPTMISIFPYPEVPPDFPYKNFNFLGLKVAGNAGPHNLHEPMTNKTWIENNPNRVYNCYFQAGMRVYDVSDPYVPKEIAYFIPPNPEKTYYDVPTPGPLLGAAEDCVVDDRGNIFMNCTHDGLYVLRVNER
jgi:hypothetical protein